MLNSIERLTYLVLQLLQRISEMSDLAFSSKLSSEFLKRFVIVLFKRSRFKMICNRLLSLKSKGFLTKYFKVDVKSKW